MNIVCKLEMRDKADCSKLVTDDDRLLLAAAFLS